MRTTNPTGRRCVELMQMTFLSSAHSMLSFLRQARCIGVLMLALMGLCAAHASPFAYVTNSDVGTISVVDTASNALVAIVPVQGAPFGVATHPLGGRAYVANSSSNTLSVVDTNTNTVVANVAVGNGPYGVAVHPSGAWVYVTNSASNTISVVNTSDNSVMTIPAGNSPVQVAFNPSGTRAYVTNLDGGNVSVIDTALSMVIATVNVGALPYGVVVNPAGTLIYVTSQYDGAVYEIDAASHAVNSMALTGMIPVGIAISPDGQRLYVTNSDSESVSVLDAATRTELKKISVGARPSGIAVHPSGARIYVANALSNSVSVIDAETDAVVATVPSISAPYSLGNFIGPLSSHPDVSVSMTARGPLTVGSLVTYTAVLSNDGTKVQPDNPGDEYVNVLPPGLTLVSAVASSGSVVAVTSTNTVAWNGSMAGSSTVTLTITAKILPADVGTPISNQGTVHYDADMDGINEASRLSDDPGVSGPADPTVFAIAAASASVAVPTLSELALLSLAFLVAGVGALFVRRRVPRR